MQEQDIQAWERELNHTQMMQEQREDWDGKKPSTATSHSEEFNEE